LNAVTEIENACDVINLDYETVKSALEYHGKYKYSYYDCLILASALKAKCRYILSEDMSNEQIIEGRLIIKNIFI
ncbi:MAG: PIN domain-containing protein, partial [Deltaproteobacteria bacterium]|jgi:predicted nucleic acid-binding protein|nr:PIN domain-containing protein [Deltaproteobacteria bacterium]